LITSISRRSWSYWSSTARNSFLYVTRRRVIMSA
jgi:hypothetical protein